ncbi:MAG: adenosylcobinamide amidohydrolase, partial [Salinirussus sp.]
EHLRGARLGPVEVYATAGLSNPAALPMAAAESDGRDESTGASNDRGPGTVNLIVGTDRALDDGALASLVAVAVEAKAATLLAQTGFPGTTTDAVIAGTDPGGDPAAFAGSATAVGGAARACVREAVTASLQSRYAEEPMPETVAEASYGLSTDQRAEVFRP